ncbi:Holliday junction branch migration protein RuvA [Sedimentibacter sp. zth1]|uniref:Holliday junction branch migration protein RuvA n=1 Tax=Sedimentibacter sp. zth1 TaxID=2816908 RepID=UPI001A92F82D|nr:Holliday junction branch migration protein RuvA [Sedimentibacter sp. zth1]QSX06409.1 Holliday junction branch migration protein RuvA [Sedimentibacter sp. zth1]
MISYIKGQIVKKGVDYLIIENNGIGYNINTSLNTLNKLSEGENTSVFTYMHVREDAILLYGFCTMEEIDMFKKLISVNGIGPKAGLAFLSTYEIDSLKVFILKEDVNAISKVPGVGKKTSQKVILDLKDKLGKLEDINNIKEIEGLSIEEAKTNNDFDDIAKVLMTLGFTQLEANKALENIDIIGKSENQIIKEALKNLNR